MSRPQSPDLDSNRETGHAALLLKYLRRLLLTPQSRWERNPSTLNTCFIADTHPGSTSRLQQHTRVHHRGQISIVQAIQIFERLIRRPTIQGPYTCDAMYPRQEINIEGQSFEVRENLSLATKLLANIGEPVTIWIDAICIDQGNVEERNHQVGIMRKNVRTGNTND